MVWDVAAKLGYGQHFTDTEGWIGDDHLPFVEKDIPAIDLIDFNYGPGNEFWHTPDDTMDKLAPRSFQIVGDVLLAVVHRFEQEKQP
jgi:Zn-dependent M28 family amino/carboxypeptidase